VITDAGAGPPTPADGTALISTPRVPVKPARLTRQPTSIPHQRREPTMPEKGSVEQSTELFDTLQLHSVTCTFGRNLVTPTPVPRIIAWMHRGVVMNRMSSDTAGCRADGASVAAHHSPERSSPGPAT